MAPTHGMTEGGWTVARGVWVLVAWAALCTVWNGYGASQIAQGLPALGPTATWADAGLAAGLGLLFIILSRRWPLPYKAIAVLSAALGAYTIFGTFTGNPADWPSEFWRWAGWP